MVKLSSCVFALACAASALAAGSPLGAHAAVHKRMMKVREHDTPAKATELAVAEPPALETRQQSQEDEDDGEDCSGNENVKRDGNSRFTFYEAGLGACGATNSDADYIVALNAEQFGNGENCFKMVDITVNGKQTQAQITDLCPGCPDGGLDFTPGLFQFFDSLDLGVLYGTWSFA